VKHDARIRTEFAKQASRFGEQGLTLSSQEYLAWMISILPLQPDFRVLDVAAGTGHLSRAIAPSVKEVVAIDMTPEMLEEARKESEKHGLKNIVLTQGDAKHLPYQDGSFDMVVSRLSLHHFEKPEVQLKEMVRVCKAHHVVGIIDLLSPDADDLIPSYNRLERLRDPSHTMALTKEQLVSAMKNAGLSIQRSDAKDIEVDFQQWTDLTKTDHSIRDEIRKELELDIKSGPKTGMRPYTDGGKLKFMHKWAIVIGTKS